MENASKALIIAGGILIGILILSIGVYIMLQSQALSASYDEKLAQDEINGYNNNFLIYAKDIRGQEMVSLINLVNETNEKNIYRTNMKISVYVNGALVNLKFDGNEAQMVNMLKESANVTPAGGVTYQNYKFKSVAYYDSGYIKELRYNT